MKKTWKVWWAVVVLNLMLLALAIPHIKTEIESVKNEEAIVCRLYELLGSEFDVRKLKGSFFAWHITSIRLPQIQYTDALLDQIAQEVSSLKYLDTLVLYDSGMRDEQIPYLDTALRNRDDVMLADSVYSTGEIIWERVQCP